MWGADAERDMMEHAEHEHPHESCGLIIDGRYMARLNVHPDPRHAFAMRRMDKLDAAAEGVVHSHTAPAPAAPSEADMRCCQSWAIPWAIVPVDGAGAAGQPFVWGRGAPIPPLIDRPYRHGVTDCYSVIRDWWRLERDVELPDYPRTFAWWEGPAGARADLYERHWADLGFREVSPADAEVGDCLLMQVRAPVPNHAAVLVEPGVILHHPGGSLAYDPMRRSRRDLAARWMPHVTRTLRLQRSYPSASKRCLPRGAG